MACSALLRHPCLSRKPRAIFDHSLDDGYGHNFAWFGWRKGARRRVSQFE